MTKTSSFGTAKREGHDSSTFYNRSLYNNLTHAPVADLNVEMPALEGWTNQLYNESSTRMLQIPDNSVALAFTSPPYNVGKDYENDLDFEDYLGLIRDVAKEVYRVLRPGGRYVINIANLGRKPYIPLHAFFYQLHMTLDFLPMGEIIWQKSKGANSNCAWGSWQSAKAPRLRDVHEYLLVFAKQSYSRPDKGISTLEQDEFMASTLSIWDIPPESAKKMGHPAPFPLELANRVINLYSYQNDVILDPFMGSGTTCVAAKQLNRHYVGFDISAEYCNLASRRLMNLEDNGIEIMPNSKTSCTELSIGFGLLNQDPLINLSEEQINQYFDQTLSLDRYTDFKQEFSRNEQLYRKLYGIGMNLRTSYLLFAHIKSVQWRGGQQQSKSIPMAKDLVVANTAISIKTDSHIVYNRSIHKLFISLPEGSSSPARTSNWYIKWSPQLHQELYTYVRERFDISFPEQVTQYYKSTKETQRKLFAQKAKELIKIEEFKKLYLRFSHDIAQKSADMFNQAITKSLNSPIHGSIKENIMRTFFRLGDAEYILCGLDEKLDFAVKIPDLTTWNQQWKFKTIEATPGLTSEQPLVEFKLVLENKQSKRVYEFYFQAQIRWSKGKFGGSPEAKLYKKGFSWVNVPFFERVYEPSPVQKQKWIGSGGFGSVYEGVFNKKKVAIKELSTVDREKYARFCREVEILSKLNHKNILPVLESNIFTTKPWFITPLAQGNLADIINDLAGNYSRIHKIFRQVLEGIKYAHDNGVIHRDLKPENILLFDNDHVKIGDFGLGKAIDSSILTHTNNNRGGTWEYAAPEQAHSFRDADHRADIYALGKTLMHMITNEVPPFLSVGNLENIPIRYRNFIEQCTYTDPKERMQTVDQVIEMFDYIVNRSY